MNEITNERSNETTGNKENKRNLSKKRTKKRRGIKCITKKIIER